MNVHCEQMATRVKKVLAGTTRGQQKETLQMTYKATGRSIDNYTAPVWSNIASNSSIKKIQTTQNEALRIATGCHLMADIDHIRKKAKKLTVKQHSDLLSEQYLVKCLDQEHVCHNITTREPPPRQMKHTLHTRHFHNVQPLLADTKKDSLMAIHTAAVAKAKHAMRDNRVLGDHPPPISSEETNLKEHRGQRFHSSAWDTVDYSTPTRVGWILPSHQTVQTVGLIHKMSHTCSVSQRILTTWFL